MIPSSAVPLTLLPSGEGSRVNRDRLELLTALIDAPNIDPLFRDEVIEFPPDHPVYGWQCTIAGCRRILRVGKTLCVGHDDLWATAKADGVSRAAFLAAATPLPVAERTRVRPCHVCPSRPADRATTGLCSFHHYLWLRERDEKHTEDFRSWVEKQVPHPGFGICQVVVCPELARSPLGFCAQHEDRYRAQGRPGEARVPGGWAQIYERRGLPVPVSYHDQALFKRWCRQEDPAYRIGVINLVGLMPLLSAELRWSLYAHAQLDNRTTWDLATIQRLVNYCRHQRVLSLFDLGADDTVTSKLNANIRMIRSEAVNGLRCIYYSPADTKGAGFLETDHFGRRLSKCQSHYDLSGVSQRWLRDLLWDYLADLLRSTHCPRSRGPFDAFRRACVELSRFLELEVADEGHDPRVLGKDHAERFVADQRHRQRHNLPSLGVARPGGELSTVTDGTRRMVFNHLRKLLFSALETDQAARLGLNRAFITAIPHGGADPKKSRNPFPDEAARALADEANLRQLAKHYDPNDRGLRDIWEAIVYTGRRCSEIITLRLDCLGRYRGLPMLWHDQTKVGNYNEGIRIPEALHARLDQRRDTTLVRFEHRQGRLPLPVERGQIALFPSHIRNPREDRPISYGFFNRAFRTWVDGLDLGPCVAHQARHTLATNLLRAGASLAHIRRYLGHVSERMAEHYTKVAHSDLEDVLNSVWVAGPGAANPGQLLSGSSRPLSREEALALALDLSRRSTPADGGFCTFQPVVDGATCPWNLDCENCDKFVLSGADLLYWRRKQEQWRSIAERAPDDATADYLHQVFEPTARAIDGLEKALAGLGLLDEALTLDLRRPQDYFRRIWSTNFRASHLAAIAEDTDHHDRFGDT